jgi:tRNA G18 (ribose-2'-O)-methylase SpoU
MAGVYPAGLPEEDGETGRLSTSLIGVLDNLRSAFNVGSILRIADGVGMAGLHLCGITPTPENPKVAKTALGAEAAVAWDYHRNALHAVAQLQAEGVRLVVLERTVGAVSLFDLDFRPGVPVALVVGNEKAGVDPAVRDVADDLAYLPMRGQKESLNVAVAFGIASYILRHLSSV